MPFLRIRGVIFEHKSNSEIFFVKFFGIFGQFHSRSENFRNVGEIFKKTVFQK